MNKAIDLREERNQELYLTSEWSGCKQLNGQILHDLHTEHNRRSYQFASGNGRLEVKILRRTMRLAYKAESIVRLPSCGMVPVS